MKNTIFVLLLVIWTVSCKNRERPKEEQKPIVEKITEEEALNLLHTWTNAYLSADTTSLDSVLDESWVYSGSPNGEVFSKTATLEEFSTADYTFHDISYEKLDIQLYGDVAVVRGSETMIIVGNSAKDTTTLSLRFTDVYQKHNGVVKAIATHSSPIEIP
ncbi:nuclear transport factor 2 family protein [Eudoraea chungangensis]|uniref:nuclear transport factor 2 family protein n=1 Tax=Eudoraea chungangensis TaxID=1481905 RepID=UPI0023EC34C0|nr:nuclear transport factor 2 family protein [Eudoraea chungangensis]